MAGKPKVWTENGVHWFSARHAAELLGTRRGKIATMVIRGLLTPHPDAGADWVAEADVTRLRRDPDALKAIMKQAHEVPAAKPPLAGGRYQPGPDQHVLPIADYRLPLDRRPKFKE